MWPFKKKDLLRREYLSDAGISSKYTDAFRLSKRQLRLELTELEKQKMMWDQTLGDLRVSHVTLQSRMERMTSQLQQEGIAKHTEQGLFVQMDQLDQEYRKDAKEVQDAMRNLRMVNKTIWLLGNIEDGTYSDPNVVSNPPERGWAGDWEDLFDGETLEELRARFDIKRPDSKAQSASDSPSLKEKPVGNLASDHGTEHTDKKT